MSSDKSEQKLSILSKHNKVIKLLREGKNNEKIIEIMCNTEKKKQLMKNNKRCV